MNTVISVDTALWGLLAGTLLPILVGLVTRSATKSGLKAILLALLAAATAVIQEAASSGSFIFKAALLKFALLFLTAVGVHFGLLKPTQVTGPAGVTSKVNP